MYKGLLMENTSDLLAVKVLPDVFLSMWLFFQNPELLVVLSSEFPPLRVEGN